MGAAAGTGTGLEEAPAASLPNENTPVVAGAGDDDAATASELKLGEAAGLPKGNSAEAADEPNPNPPAVVAGFCASDPVVAVQDPNGDAAELEDPKGDAAVVGDPNGVAEGVGEPKENTPACENPPAL